MNENLTNVAWKCITCGKITYMPGCDAKTPELEIRETTQCLQCLRGGEPVSQRLRDRILAKYASGEY
ncbi:hypothetical protein ES707_04055 [subsurface metagenome]